MMAREKKARVPVGIVIAILFIASGGVRFFGGTAKAIALEMESVAPIEREEDEKRSGGAMLDQVFAELKAREEALNARENHLDRRAQELETVSRTAQQKMVELKGIEDSLRDTIALAQRAAEDDITQLTNVYASMKPKEAAAVFEEMEPAFAAGFLGRMPPESAARIVAGLDPATAYSISVFLAGRNVNVPKE